MSNKEIKKQPPDADEWVKLVHEGTCCAFNDPQEEEKKAFIKKVKTNSDQNSQS